MPQKPLDPPQPPPRDGLFVAAPPLPAAPEPPPVGAGAVRLEDHRADSPQSFATRVLRHYGADLLSLLASMVLHTIVLLALAYLVFNVEQVTPRELVVASLTDSERLELRDSAAVMPDVSTTLEQPAAISALPTEVRLPDAPDIASPLRSRQVTARTTRPADLTRRTAVSELLRPTHAPVGGGFEGRTAERRAQLVAERGGSPESEAAVRRALQWLIAHQREDGGWLLNHQAGPCNSRCGNPGTIGTSTGATALALLPFLGAGHTHRAGDYIDVVDRGLYYLMGRMVETRHGGDLREGTMYAQGLAAIALCEAYALTGDEELKPFAQKAIDFIVTAQHPRGGWRYDPGEPGDTTVTGWQLMALKSARLARLHVPSHTTESAKEFLNSVGEYGGAFYGYQERDKQPGPTAVGLLLRMYLGWRHDRLELLRGTTYLAATGPSKTDMYFNYYATQVLHHYDAPNWESWNLRMREHLISTQATSGHERGSWYFADRHGTVGGRLYTTAICAMILEVYYRHLPLYGAAAIEDQF